MMKKLCYFMVLCVCVSACCKQKDPRALLAASQEAFKKVNTLSGTGMSSAIGTGDTTWCQSESSVFLFKQYPGDSTKLACGMLDLGSQSWFINDTLSGTLYPAEGVFLKWDHSESFRSTPGLLGYPAMIGGWLESFARALEQGDSVEVSADSTRRVTELVTVGNDTLINGYPCTQLHRVNTFVLTPKSNQPAVNYKELKMFHQSTLALDKESKLPVYYYYELQQERDGVAQPGIRQKQWVENFVVNGVIEDARFYPASMEGVKLVNSLEELLGKVAVGDPAPAFAATDLLTGKTYTLDSLKGKVVVLRFTSQNCGFCVLSQADMNAICTAYAENPDVLFFHISTDSPEALKKYAESQGVQGVVVATNEWFGWNYGITGIPAYRIVDRKGKLVFAATGHNPEALRAALQKQVK